MRFVLAGVVVLLAAQAQAKELLWGDTHLHSYYSPDAYFGQNFSVGPDTAYDFARGLPVIHPTTRTRVQLQTPLDFLVVSDHAESMGVFRAAVEGNIPSDDLGPIDRFTAWLVGKVMGWMIKDPSSITWFLKFSTAETTDVVESAKHPANLPIPNAALIQRNTWQDIVAAADAANRPGEFSAIIGWEWSAIPAGANLHRIVITASDASVASQFVPFASSQSNYPEDLWRWLDKTSRETGAQFIAIPHNSNISRGFMFPAERTLRDEPINPEWLALRERFERVVEATQFKGDSEADPALSPDDPFAGFERFPHYLKPGVAEYQAERGDFVRSALRTGLELEQRFGVNPYRFGLIGSTDSHTGLATAEEPNFWGKYADESLPEQKSRASSHIEKMGWAMSAQGLAAVWAEANTREAIFAAFHRREVYTTTGPRIALRVHASDQFVAGDENNPDIDALAAKAVPMGGQLSALGNSPSLLIHAAKDPRSAHLDRIQVIKGWIDGSVTHEKIYDVAWSGARKLGPGGQLPAVVDSVDPATGRYSNEGGAATLSVLWQDPDFDPAQSAFYYVRVLELPTPRHSVFDAIALGIDPVETGQAISIQERAYSSPIWYIPSAP